MPASEMGSEDWWEVVKTMPPVEAIEQLESYKSTILETTIGKPEYINSAAVIHRVNFEIKRRNVQMNNASWYKALDAVLTPAMKQEVLEWKKMMEFQDE